MATGQTLIIISPLQNSPPSSDFATMDTRNFHPVLDFDDTTNESAIFNLAMPRGYGGNGLTVYIHYSMTTAIALTVDWDVAFERVGDGSQDVDSDGFATANSIDNSTVPGTSGHVDIVNVTFTDGADMDSIAAGEKFRLKLTRDASSDDATGDAEFHMMEIKET